MAEPADTPATPPASPPPLSGMPLVLGSAALSLATFMNVLDTSIANVSVPTIAGDLGVSPHQGTWVITSFFVSLAISVPLTGWLTARFGAVRLFVVTTLLFTFASLLCGLAPTLGSLVFFRMLQGAAAGPMIPLSQTLMLATYPREKMGTALAISTMTTMVAPVVGPVLGGWISDHLSWPWIFYINLPLGLVAAWVTWAIYRDRETPIRKNPVDMVGLVLLFAWVGCLQFMLDRGNDLDWFNSPTIITLACIALVGFVLFIIWELTDEHPAVDLSLFRRRNFAVGCLALSLGFAAYFGSLVVLPLWLQTQMGYTALRAGLVMAPTGLVAILFTPLVGRILDRYEPRPLITFAFVVFAIVLAMRAGYTTQVDFAGLWIPSVILGLAVATFGVPMIALTLSGVDASRFAAAAGLSNFVRLSFGAIGASVSTTLWDHRSSQHHAHLAEIASPLNPVFNESVQQMQQIGFTTQEALGAVEQMVSQQADMLGVNDFFLFSTALYIVLAGLVWLAKPVRSGAAA